jgi:hypothetical protein
MIASAVANPPFQRNGFDRQYGFFPWKTSRSKVPGRAASARDQQIDALHFLTRTQAPMEASTRGLAHHDTMVMVGENRCQKLTCIFESNILLNDAPHSLRR